MSKNHKYNYLKYKTDIVFNGEVLEDKKVIIDTKRKIVYFRNKNEFIKKYMNEKWFKELFHELINEFKNNILTNRGDK